MQTQIENPLVRVGLVPQDLADIFLTPQAEERDKRPSHRITGVRVLTSNKYVKIMMREKDRKEKEASKKKQQQKEERERKKMEKEKEQERKKAEREERRKGRGKGKGKRPLQYSSGEDEEISCLHQPKSRGTRLVRAPERYRESSPENEESDTVCFLCNSREPPIACSRVFWVDCDNCSEWAHTHCALGSNTATSRFVCEKCCQLH